MYRAIREEIKKLDPAEKKAYAKDKKSAVTSTIAVSSTALGSAAMELVNESLPMEWFASAGVVGFLGWAVVKVFMVEAEANLEHLMED